MQRVVEKIFFALIRFEINGTDIDNDIKNSITPEVLPALFHLSKKHDLAHLIGDALDKNSLLPDGLGINERVFSPTFNILKCYNGDKYDFYHIDAYRLEGVKQDLGLEEYIEGDDVCFIEWSEFVSYLLPDEYLKMEILVNDDETRTINITGVGKNYENVEKEIERVW